MENQITPVVNSPLPLDIGRCFNDAIAIYKKNILILLLATFLLHLLTICTLFVLAGVLYGGYSYMLLNAMRGAEKKVVLGDMFKMFSKFWPLTWLFSLQGTLIFLGFLLLIIPGLIISTFWLYSYYFMIDKGQKASPSMKMSRGFVRDKGFWANLILCVIYIIISGASLQIPFVGAVLNIFLVPLASLLLTSAYLQQ